MRADSHASAGGETAAKLNIAAGPLDGGQSGGRLERGRHAEERYHSCRRRICGRPEWLRHFRPRETEDFYRKLPSREAEPPAIGWNGACWTELCLSGDRFQVSWFAKSQSCWRPKRSEESGQSTFASFALSSPKASKHPVEAVGVDETVMKGQDRFGLLQLRLKLQYLLSVAEENPANAEIGGMSFRLQNIEWRVKGWRCGERPTEFQVWLGKRYPNAVCPASAPMGLIEAFA